MDLYDPQTLGVMVFGGFMVVSAVGIFLVSTFSMKETSYEEALAKQRKEHEKNLPKGEKKKKEKLLEKKGKSKKKEEKPNGKIPEHFQESANDDDSVSELIIKEEEVPEVHVEVPVVPVVVPVKASAAVKASATVKGSASVKVSAQSPAPVKASAVKSPVPSSVSASVAVKAQSQAPVNATASSVVKSSAPAPVKSSAPAPVKSSAPAPVKSSAPAPVKSSALAPVKSSALAPVKSSAPAPVKSSAPAPVKNPAPTLVSAVTPAPEKNAPSPKDKKKKQEKKVQKVEPSLIPAVSRSQTMVSKSVPVLEASTKEVPVIAVSPVGSQPPKKAEIVMNQEDLKQEVAQKKKNAPKKKAESTVDENDGAVYIPYKTLVPTVRAMCFSKPEAQKLIEILTEKSGIVQDSWQMATQKGDPVAALKRVVEEKEKLLSAQTEKTTSYKDKFVAINKELQSEKAKGNKEQSKQKEQLLAREQEINALQARMQASYQDHVNETQQLNAKIRSLQEEIANGPSAQLTRLQQENSILRDALNQATSQTESKQNAELAKLRQECSKLAKDLSEKSESLHQEEQRRKVLDGKILAYEKQVTQLQTLQQEGETSLQKRLSEVNEELRKSQSNYQVLLADVEKAKGEQETLTDLQAKLQMYEAEGMQKSEELDKLNTQLKDSTDENAKLTERIKSIEALLEAGQSRDGDGEQQESKEAEITQLHDRLQEKDAQIVSLEKEAAELKEAMEQQKNKNNDLREKNWQAMEALGLAEKNCAEKLSSEKKAKEEVAEQLNSVQSQTKEALHSLFPHITLQSKETYSEWLQEFQEKSSEVLSQQAGKDDSAELLVKAEEAQGVLQKECEQYRTILGETEGMLKALQKSVEEEEQIWKEKLRVSEEELLKSHLHIKALEETVEKLKLDLQSTEQLKECISVMEVQLETHMTSASTECQNYSQEVESLRQLLSDSQEHLEATKKEAKKQSSELSLLRQQLSEIQNHVNDREKHGLEDHKISEEKLPQETIGEHSTLAEMQEQRSVHSLQEELEKLKSTEETSSGPEEVQYIKGEDHDSSNGTSV